MITAATYIAAWSFARLSGVALLAVTARLFTSFREHDEWPEFRLTLALIGYPCAITLFAITRVADAAVHPSPFVPPDLWFPGLAVLIAAALGFAEWRYLNSSNDGATQ